MTYPASLRRKVLARIEEGMGKREAARLFKISPNTLYEWLGRGDDLSPRPAKMRTRKVDKAALRLHVREHPDALLRERAAVFKVTPEAICYLMKTMKIVKKTA
jgi:putative transposase